MSLSNILKATAAMVMEAKVNAIDMFVEYMREKIEIDDEFMELVKEFKNSVNEDTVELSKSKKKGGADEKNVVERKRPPTAYHIFMSETSARLRDESPSMSKKEVQDEAKRLWKEKKESEPVPPKGKKGKKKGDSSESASISADDTITKKADDDSDSDSENVVVQQRIQAAVEKKIKTVRAKKGSKKSIVADLVDELTSDE